MAATITETLKRNILIDLYNRTQNIGLTLGDSDRHYLAIGRSEAWDSDLLPPVPNPSKNDVIDFQGSIQSMKLVPDVSYVAPRYSWVTGNQYEAWDDRYHSNTDISAQGDITNPYYVITEDNSVYICIQQGKTAQGIVRNSLYKPTDTSGKVFSAGDDGYFWRFMYNIGAAQSRKFLTANYMPVEKILDSSQGGPSFGDLSVSRVQQLQIQSEAIPGQMIGIAVDSGGTGYTSRPTINIQPVGSSYNSAEVIPAAAYCNVNDFGRITEVIMKTDSTTGDSDGSFSFGRNYFNAAITISGGGGSGAVLRAIITSDSGMGGNPINDLNSSALMFNTTLEGAEGTDFQITNDFRQIGIVRNPLKDSAQYQNFSGSLGDSVAQDVTLSAFKKLYVSSGLSAANITGDQIVSGTSTATAIVDYYNDEEQVLYVHQTRQTGFLPFDSSDTVSVSEGGGAASVVAVAGMPVLRPAEVDRFSGEVIYIDNRSPVIRDNEQTEDIKVIIDL
jgi:hypothetical protein